MYREIGMTDNHTTDDNRPPAASGMSPARESVDRSLLSTFLSVLKRQTDASAICLWLRDDEGMRLRVADPGDLPVGELLPFPGGAIGDAAKEGVLRFVLTPSDDLDFSLLSLLEDRLRSSAVAVFPVGDGYPPRPASLSLHLPRLPRDPAASLFEWARWAKVIGLMLPDKTPERDRWAPTGGDILHRLDDLHLVTGGLARRVNERLSTILPSLERAIRLLDEDDPALRFLRYVDEGLDRTSGLLTRLLTFSGDGPLIAESVSIGECVAETVRRLDPERSHGVRLTASIPTRLPFLVADRIQVIAALMEVVRNALEAAPEGTEVTIAIEQEEDGLSVTVTDEGLGMTDDVLRQAVIPFFSTRRPGDHPGLGLSTVEGCVRRHGGSLSLTSQRGTGTRARLWFPLQIRVP